MSSRRNVESKPWLIAWRHPSRSVDLGAGCRRVFWLIADGPPGSHRHDESAAACKKVEVQVRFRTRSEQTQRLVGIPALGVRSLALGNVHNDCSEMTGGWLARVEYSDYYFNDINGLVKLRACFFNEKPCKNWPGTLYSHT